MPCAWATVLSSELLKSTAYVDLTLAFIGDGLSGYSIDLVVEAAEICKHLPYRQVMQPDDVILPDVC